VDLATRDAIAAEIDGKLKAYDDDWAWPKP